MQKNLLIILVTLFSLPIFAQPIPKQKDIESNLHSIDSFLGNKRVFQSLHIAPVLTTIDVEDINKWASDMLESEFSKSGLEYSLGYDHRFCDYDKIDDSYEGGNIIAYKHRFLVLLKWNIMQSGLIDRENFRQKVDILSRTKSQEIVNSTIKTFVIESSEQLINDLYAYYNVLIDAKVDLYGELIAMQEELVAKNRATMLSLSDMKIKRANTLRMRKGNTPAGGGVIDLDNYIASQSLFIGNEYDSLIENNNTILQNKLSQELTLNEAEGISYWKEVSVSPYVRMSNYLDNHHNNKNIGNLGFTASFPILTNTKSKRKEIVSRGKLLENEEQVIRRGISFNVADLVQRLNENFATLSILVEGAKHYDESCELATQYYNNNTITIHELSQRYIDSIDNNIEIYKLIIAREQMKHALFNVIYGVQGYRY